MCWTICKASIFDWIKKTPQQPNPNPTTINNSHPATPCQLQLSVTSVLLWWKEQKQRKKILWYVAVLSLLQLQIILFVLFCFWFSVTFSFLYYLLFQFWFHCLPGYIPVNFWVFHRCRCKRSIVLPLWIQILF